MTHQHPRWRARWLSVLTENLHVRKRFKYTLVVVRDATSISQIGQSKAIISGELYWYQSRPGSYPEGRMHRGAFWIEWIGL